MNYPFSNNISLKVRRLFGLGLALVMISTAMTGCFAKKDPDPSENTDPNMPNLIETGDPTNDPTETPTEAPTEPEFENVATAKEQLNIRSAPSTGSNITKQLDAGELVQVLRVEPLHGVLWAYINPINSDKGGWVAADLLDMSKVSAAIIGTVTQTPAGNGEIDPPEATQSTEPTSSTNLTGNGTKGVVTASELNIRKDASSSSERVGSLKYGDRVSVTETKNGWGKVKEGWISMDYVYVDGQRGKNTAVGTVTATQLLVRSGPGTGYDKVNSLNQGARVDILEQIKVGNTTCGCISGGWVCMDYISTDSNSGGTTTSTGTATVTGNGLNIRSGAGTNFSIVGTLKMGDVVTILSTKDVDGVKWGEIAQGWICLDYVKMN